MCPLHRTKLLYPKMAESLFRGGKKKSITEKYRKDKVTLVFLGKKTRVSARHSGTGLQS